MTRKRPAFVGLSRSTKYRRKKECVVSDTSSDSSDNESVKMVCSSDVPRGDERLFAAGLLTELTADEVQWPSLQDQSSSNSTNISDEDIAINDDNLHCNTDADCCSCNEASTSHWTEGEATMDSPSSSDNQCSSDGESSLSEEDKCSSNYDDSLYEEDNFGSDLNCLEMHFLEEEPVNPHQEDVQLPQGDLHHPCNDPDQDDNPDDPDDPEGDANEENVSSDEDDVDVQAIVADLAHGDLDMLVNANHNVTKGEMILMELAAGVRHKNTFIRALDSFKNYNVLCGPRFFPESKTKLWDIIRLNSAGIVRHVYCGRTECGKYIGKKNNLGNMAVCECGFATPTSKAKFFVTLNFSNQIRYLLSIPGMWNHLQYRSRRQKHSPTAIEDIFDASEFQRLQLPNGILASNHNFCYIFNLDGCKPSKKGEFKMWPLYVRLMDLPPEMRQKFCLLAAVYIDKVDPNFNSYMKPFVKEANRLLNRGISWRPDGVNEVISRFVPIAHCVDSPARCGILNMAQWNSENGCTYCTHPGIQLAGSNRYPRLNLEGIPPFHERSHAGMVGDLIQAQANIRNRVPLNARNVRGHKGATQLLLLQSHDLREGQGVDDLHQDHEGTAKDITELLLTLAPRVDPEMANIDLIRSVDARLLPIKTPSRISRKPRTIAKRKKYSGTEWRNWLLAYGVPCLMGLVRPEYLNILESLSYACYLLSQDSIEPAHIDTAEQLLQEGVAEAFEGLFGVERCKFNLHVTTSHKANCVRKLGPPWTYSTYNFESLNMKACKMVTSPKGAAMQIVTRSLLELTVNAAQYDGRYCEEVRIRLKDMLNKERLHRVLQVAPNMYMVGSSDNVLLEDEDHQVLRREGIVDVHNVREFKSFLIHNTRYKSSPGVNADIKSDDSFMYTYQDTFCTIRKIVVFNNGNGEQMCGVFVREHDVAYVLPIARHISILRNIDADLNHFLQLNQIRCPAIKINIDGTVYAVCVPNCFEID